MAANNIFSDQDFEKTPNEKKSKKPLIYSGIIAALIAAGAIGYGILGNSGDEGKPENPPVAMVSDTIATTSNVDSAEVKTDVEEAQVVEEPKQEIDSKPIQPTQDVQKTSTPVEEVKAAAISVIRGNYGNNPERRRKLGDRYPEIQSKVNEMYRNGEVR
jgi:hypothetical protein